MADDIFLQLPAIVKARTEEIVIRNQDPTAKRVDLYQSLRPMRDGIMGDPIKHFIRSVPIDNDLCSIVIDGITGLQVMTWISIWAAGINAEDGPKAAQSLGA
jgi:hypothetical protein